MSMVSTFDAFGSPVGAATGRAVRAGTRVRDSIVAMRARPLRGFSRCRDAPLDCSQTWSLLLVFVFAKGVPGWRCARRGIVGNMTTTETSLWNTAELGCRG